MHPIILYLLVLLPAVCLSLRLGRSIKPKQIQGKRKRFDSDITFTIQPLSGDHFTTDFFHDMISELRSRPQYVADIKKANLIFVEYDSLRQCIYPELTYTCEKHNPNSTDVLPTQGDIDDFARQFARQFVRMDDMSLNPWATDPSPFIGAVIKMFRQVTNRQVIIYFANVNSWSQGPTHRDITAVKRTEIQLGVRIFFVGLDLVKSSMDPTTAVNMLMPLLPTGDFYNLSHTAPDPNKHVCKPRPLLASFVGTASTQIRKHIFDLHNESIGIICNQTHAMGEDGGMKNLLLNSTFGFAPRGDDHYSFRLTEVLAAGAVPVLIDDEAMPPYGANSSRTWAVIIRESEIFKAPEILQALDSDAICRMRKEGRNILSYARDMKGTVDGLLAGLQQKFLES